MKRSRDVRSEEKRLRKDKFNDNNITFIFATFCMINLYILFMNDDSPRLSVRKTITEKKRDKVCVNTIAGSFI
jgi:hypothetical protein